MAFKYGTSLLLKATDVYHVLRVVKTTSKDNKEDPPNTVLGLSCPNDVGEHWSFSTCTNYARGRRSSSRRQTFPFLRDRQVC